VKNFKIRILIRILIAGPSDFMLGIQMMKVNEVIHISGLVVIAKVGEIAW